MINHMVTLKEEEVPKEDSLLGEILFLEEEEEVEEVELNVMPVERHDTCLGNFPRKRNKEKVKLKFNNHIEEMLKQKE